METLTKERRVLDEDMASTERRLKAALIELRCPDCKCSDQIDAESSECGCDSPVCSRDGSMTLAEAYVKALSDRNPPPGHLRDEKGVDFIDPVPAWGDDVPLMGDRAPKDTGQIAWLIQYLRTVHKRYGNTVVVVDRLRWGASALHALAEREAATHAAQSEGGTK